MGGDGLRCNDRWCLDLYDLSRWYVHVTSAGFGGENLLEALLTSDFLNTLEVLSIC